MDIDSDKLRRALRRLLDRRSKLRGVFYDQLQRDAARMDQEELEAFRATFQALTPDQHELIERALEAGFRAGRPDADRGDFVFLAYAREDAEPMARLHDALTDAGVRCFMDTRDIPPGAEWNDATVEALSNCAGLIVAISSSSAASDYVKSEVQTVFDDKKPVFPITLDASVPPESIDNRLRTRMVTNFVDKSALAKLVERLQSLF